jgi:hypothetical protein
MKDTSLQLDKLTRFRGLKCRHDGNDERTGIVVDTVTMCILGHGIGRVLQDAGIVGHGKQVTEIDVRQACPGFLKRLRKRPDPGLFLTLGADFVENREILRSDIFPQGAA